ncbi:uncharacterized protein [Dermacentor albipictus]|uniref:uncharacterized protein isoform X2 n=1 Tax=Dermacentor albipictus TaxID=60249 RepID=UPI0038FC00E5
MVPSQQPLPTCSVQTEASLQEFRAPNIDTTGLRIQLSSTGLHLGDLAGSAAYAQPIAGDKRAWSRLPLSLISPAPSTEASRCRSTLNPVLHAWFLSSHERSSHVDTSRLMLFNAA